MLKIVICMKRRPEMSRAEFQAYWKEVHTKVVHHNVFQTDQSIASCLLLAQKSRPYTLSLNDSVECPPSTPP